MKCRYCGFANFIINKCLIDCRKLYDNKGKELIQDCIYKNNDLDFSKIILREEDYETDYDD